MNANEHKASGSPRTYVMIGAGYLARQLIERYPGSGCCGFFVDAGHRDKESYLGLPVFGDLAEIENLNYLLAAGDLGFRDRFVARAREAGLKPVSAITGRARFVADSATIADGTILTLDAIIEYNARIGPHCLIMDRVLIAHDVLVGDNVLVAPGTFIGRSARVGRRVFIGANAAIAPGVMIGDNCHIAMGATCFRDIPAGSTVIGNPGRVVAREPGAVGGGP